MSSRFGVSLGALGSAWPVLGAIALAALLATPVLAPSSGSIHSEQDAGRQRLTELASGLGYDVRSTVVSPTQASGLDPASTLLVVGDPSAGFASTEASWTSAWRSDGGRLLVADGTGGARAVFSELGVPLTQRRILDAQLGARDPTTVPANLSLEGTEHELPMDQPFVLPLGDGDAPDWNRVARTGSSSFVDLNGNGRLDDPDTRGPFVVGVRSEEGRAVLLTSAAFLENDELADPQTRSAVEALSTSLLPGGGTLVVDASHADHGLAGDVVLAVARPVVGVLASPTWGVLAVVAVASGVTLALWGRTRPVGRWDEGASKPDEVTREGEPPDVGFMRQAASSLKEESSSGGVSDRRRALLEALGSHAANENGRSNA